MTSIIHVLDQQTANSIAAGEVVERPASVIKELVENALDAGASVISAEIRQGGVSLIRVADNGGGMSRDDAMLAFARHATSKILKIEDLDSLATMGFRGEALASIASVARVRLETRRPEDEQGSFVQINGGEMIDSGLYGGPAGTTIQVENLFYNVPARFKFLRKDATEAGVVADVLERLALARPDVSFRLISNQQEILHTPGNNDLTSTVYAVYGRQAAAACLPVSAAEPPLRLTGLIGRPDLARNSRAQQSFFVNGRLVRSKTMTAALDEAYATLLMKGKYALAVLFLDLPAQLVDVNVHPQKMEVRFWNDQDVFRMIYHALKNALATASGIVETPDAENKEPAIAVAASEVQSRPAHSEQQLIASPAETSVNPGIPFTSAVQPAVQPIEYPQSADTLLTLADAAAAPALAAGLSEPDKVQPAQLLKINDLDRARLIGQLFDTYLLLELDQELLLVDQHAAHEKILFESLLARRRQALINHAPPPIQPLLTPLVISLSRQEILFLQNDPDKVRQLGFEFDLFGTSSVALRSCPDDGRQQIQPEPAFRIALETMLAEPLDNEDQIADFYYSMACKAAVKAHDHLKAEEIHRLLSDLKHLDNPYQCPHGRPVIVRLPIRELEKRFKRIV